MLKLKSENGGKSPVIIYDSQWINHFHDKQRLQLSLEGKNGLNGTIYTFNKLMASGKDTEFNKDVDAMKGAAIIKAPFYAMIVNPRITYTPGGVRINTNAEVLSLDTGKPIPGLFACGEVTGGIHGESRLTAGSSPDCGTFGLISAENIDKHQRI